MRGRQGDQRILTGATLALLVLGASRTAPGVEPRKVEDVFLTREQALEEIFPGAGRIETTELRFLPEEKDRVESRIGRRLFERSFEVFRALGASGSLTGYAIITEEIGKYQPITFVVGVSPDARVTDVAVMVYRECIGAEVKRRRFLAQFRNKTVRSRLQINRDVIHVSGATLSSRAIARGIRKVLHAIDECVIGPRGRRNLAWRAVSEEERVTAPAVGAAGEGPAGSATAGKPIRRARYLMGTVLEMVCYGDPDRATRALEDAFAEVSRLETLLSTYREESEISRVNTHAATSPVRVSAETLACVESALAFARRTGGAFDPTLTARGHEAVRVDREAGTVRFLRPGLRLDLGGIGKGFALDRAARVLEERGVTRALFNFGGQVLALDAPPGEKAWIVPVRDPEDSTDALGYFEVVRASVSTSATYERGDHIVDPRSGEAVRGTLSATVCARSATDADALSTALDVLGPGAARRLTGQVPGGAALIVSAVGTEPIAIETPGAPRFVPMARSER